MHHAFTLSELFNGVLFAGGFMLLAYVGFRVLAEKSRELYH